MTRKNNPRRTPSIEAQEKRLALLRERLRALHQQEQELEQEIQDRVHEDQAQFFQDFSLSSGAWDAFKQALKKLSKKKTPEEIALLLTQFGDEEKRTDNGENT